MAQHTASARVRARRTVWALALLLSASVRAKAQEAEASAAEASEDSELTIEELGGLSLQDLLNVPVVTASKQAESASSASAIISVVTADEIALWGYRSVAEALMYVPGLYPLFDFLSHDVGVRGIQGGLGAYSRSIKVMIDGQQVSFRSSASNFLGPEFIAMDAIDRIEVVRGPASALYGANAFLGVINIITRKPGRAVAGALGARGGTIREHAWGGLASGRIEAGLEHVQALVAGSGGWLDRSGHPLPRSSPHYEDFAANGAPKSQDDIAVPRNAYTRVQATLGDHALSLNGHYSVLDSHAEFLDYGQLSHDNRVVLKAGSVWLEDTWRPSRDASVLSRVAYANGGPGDAEHLSTGTTTSYKRRAFGFSAFDATLEGQLTLRSIHTLTAGADFTQDREELMRVYSVDAATGAETLEAGTRATRDFRNVGAYGQYRVEPLRGATANAAGRFDHHNIYGDVFTYRAGWVHAAVPRFTYKLLFGTSFRAPTAVQLFGQSLYAGDARGNPNLKPERARTAELGLEWRVLDQLALLATGCWIEVEDKIEVVPEGIIARPRNIGEQQSLCAEGEVKWMQAWSTLLVTVAYVHGTTRTLAGAALFTDADDERPSDLYPMLNATLRWSAALGRFGTFGVALRYASARRASASNVAENRGEGYELDPYLLADAIYGLRLGSHRIELAARNLFGHRYSEPGFAGVDVPGRGRELTLGYRYQFE